VQKAQAAEAQVFEDEDKGYQGHEVFGAGANILSAEDFVETASEETVVKKEGVLKKRVVAKEVSWCDRFVSLTADKLYIRNEDGGDIRDAIVLMDITYARKMVHEECTSSLVNAIKGEESSLPGSFSTQRAAAEASSAPPPEEDAGGRASLASQVQADGATYSGLHVRKRASLVASRAIARMASKARSSPGSVSRMASLESIETTIDEDDDGQQALQAEAAGPSASPGGGECGATAGARACRAGESAKHQEETQAEEEEDRQRISPGFASVQREKSDVEAPALHVRARLASAAARARTFQLSTSPSVSQKSLESSLSVDENSVPPTASARVCPCVCVCVCVCVCYLSTRGRYA